MAAIDKNPKVDEFIGRSPKWQEELSKLRSILLNCGLTEELKWGAPCYTYNKTNLIVINGFKDYCTLYFFKGSVLSDPEGIMIRAQETTQAGRHIRFTSVKEITTLRSTLTAYIYEAIEAERAGLKVKAKKQEVVGIPEEFQLRLNKSAALKKAFHALTPGRQKAYLLHFAEPKQEKTRISRIEKCIPQILEGKGLHDQYIR